jgi:transposase
MVGLLMTKDGYPVGHEVFSGNIGDIKAFRAILTKVKLRFKIDRIVFVCDRGMISKENLEYLDTLDFEYILGVRMRKQKKELRDVLLSPDNFKEVIKDRLLVKEVEIEGRRYIVCNNPQEAEQEKIKREYFAKILQDKVDIRTVKDWVVKNGYRKYITIKNAGITVDDKKLKEEAIYDGMWVLMTNTDFSSEEVSKYYKDLCQIEQCFRELKNQLETGPMYHWKDRRIRAHVFIGFLSLIMKVALKKAIKSIDSKVLYCDVMDKLRQVRVLQLKLGDVSTIVRTELPDGAYIAYKALGIRPVNRILEYRRE